MTWQRERKRQTMRKKIWLAIIGNKSDFCINEYIFSFIAQQVVHCAFNLPIRWFCGWFDDHTILYGLCWMSQPINETKKKKNEKNWRTKKSNQKANLSSELTSQAELRLQYYHPSLMNKLSMNDIKIRNVHPLALERGCCAALGCARTCAISANVTLHESHAQNCEKDIAKSNRFDLLFYSSSSDCCLFPLGYRSFVRSIF